MFFLAAAAEEKKKWKLKDDNFILSRREKIRNIQLKCI